MQDSLDLKWGTLKGWNLKSAKAQEAIGRYLELDQCASAACQEMTPEHKARLCDLIDVVDGEIVNDWTGETLTKEQAKDYVTSYGKK